MVAMKVAWMVVELVDLWVDVLVAWMDGQLVEGWVVWKVAMKVVVLGVLTVVG